jgi:2-iminoacetate synthase
MDYARPFTRKTGEQLIEGEIPSIPNDTIREKIRFWLADIENGKRDFRV